MKRSNLQLAVIFASAFLLLLDIFLATFIISLYQLRYLDTSFAIGPLGNPLALEFSKTAKNQLPDLQGNTFIKNEVLKNSGFTLGFDIKTSAQNTIFFSGTSDKGTGSVYWNLNLVDGKIQTARLGRIEPLLVNRKINDNLWHQVLITQDKELKLFIDEVLESRAAARQLLPGTIPTEKWFNFYRQPNANSRQAVELKNIAYVNKTLSPEQWQSFINYFKGSENIKVEILKSSSAAFISLTLIALLLIIFIKRSYPQEPIPSVIGKISFIYLAYSLVAFSLWTEHVGKIISLSTLLSLCYLLHYYRKLVPESLGILLLTPVNVLYTSFGLLLTKRSKLLPYISSLEPWMFFLILALFIALIFYNPSFFTFIP